MIVHLDTTVAGMADLLSQAMVMEGVADYAVEIAQAEVGQLDKFSEAMARKAGDDCAVEVALASTDQVDWVSVAGCLAEGECLARRNHHVVLSASLDFAECGGVAESNLLLVLSARPVQVLVLVVARLGGPVQVGLGGAVCHAELLGPIAGVLQAWPLPLLGPAAWVAVLDGVQLPVLESNLVQWIELRLSGDHQLSGALVILMTYQTVPSMLAPVTCPGCGHGARAGPARLASGAPSTVCQLPATPQLLRPAPLP
jgi:hypothetical protein